MAAEWAVRFYRSKAWRQCRLTFLQSKYFLCKRCASPATIVHHKRYLTPTNINDPYITLNWDNLEAVCDDCHNKIHHGDGEVTREGTYFNDDGQLVQG